MGPENVCQFGYSIVKKLINKIAHAAILAISIRTRGLFCVKHDEGLRMNINSAIIDYVDTSFRPSYVLISLTLYVSVSKKLHI